MTEFPTQTVLSSRGADIFINAEKVVIKEPDMYHPKVGEIPGDTIELSTSDVHEITKALRESFGIDITKSDYKKQIEYE